jgi:hypothetical protein
VSKHTTCGDVDEGGVKRLVKVPVHRCRRRNVDVGAVLLGTNKVRKNLGQKRLTKVVKICVKITPDFLSKGQMNVKRGTMVLRRVSN